jgi:hypothetical protein
VAVAKPGAYGQNQVALEENLVTPTSLGLQPGHAGEQLVILREGALTHQRDLNGDGQILSQGNEFVRRVGDDHAAAGQNQWTPRGEQHVHRGADGFGARCRDIDRQGRVEGLVVAAGSALHIDRKVDQHRTGAAGAGDAECLAEDPGGLGGFLELDGPLGDRLGDFHDVDGLERLLVELRARRLAGDADHRNRVGQRGVEAGDHVGAGRPCRRTRRPCR